MTEIENEYGVLYGMNISQLNNLSFLWEYESGSNYVCVTDVKNDLGCVGSRFVIDLNSILNLHLIGDDKDDPRISLEKFDEFCLRNGFDVKNFVRGVGIRLNDLKNQEIVEFFDMIKRI